MNKDTAQGSWTEMKGRIMTRWGKLTHSDIDELKGNVEQIAGKLQSIYGYAKEKAEQEYRDFKASLAENKNTKN